MSRYETMFATLASEAAAAFVPFVVLGDPDLETSRRIVESLIAGGADALELGIPFSDPIADGPTIQQSVVRALQSGATPERCFELLADVRRAHPLLPIGLLVYANLITHAPIEQFYVRAAEAGVDSVLAADIPTLEVEPFVEAACATGIAPVLIAPPNVSEARLERIARLSAGYTYVVTRAGVTGAEHTAHLAQSTVAARLRALGAAPPMVGFGISQPEHVREARRQGFAGTISGSAVVGRVTVHLGDEAAMHAALRGFVQDMRAASREPLEVRP